MAEYRLSAAAQKDIVNILTRAHEQFGDIARQRYETLLATALQNIALKPNRPGSLERAELGEHARSWHLALSRERARTKDGVVRRPRHLLIYRTDDNRVIVGRVLHDAMELARHPGAWHT